MIVKEKEFKDLQESLVEQKEKYVNEIKALKAKIVELEKLIKPEEIKVKYFEYLENPYNSSRPSWNKDFILGNFELESSISLSSGVRRQILGLLRDIKRHFAEKYVDAYEKMLKSNELKNKERLKIIKQNIIKDLLTEYNNEI